jgi:lycopene beta-cyclase
MQGVTTPLDYDYVISGAGVSGLCLADALTHRFPDCRVLMVDPDLDPDYNISFWWEGEMPFPAIETKKWQQIAVQMGKERRVCPLKRYQMHAFWRSDFDAYLRERLHQTGRVEFWDATVTQIHDFGTCAEVVTSAGSARSRWLFDSRQKNTYPPDMLVMGGLAWEVRTQCPVFDPDTVTLFDFLPSTPGFDFIYVLPYTSTTALINYAAVTYSGDLVPQEQCADALDHYLTAQGAGEYKITRSYRGCIPLSPHRVTRQTTGRVLDIGVRGGMLKPSTSYAFAHILADTNRIIEALSDTSKPFYKKTRRWYYQLTDARMLKMFVNHPEIAQNLMYHMFQEEDGDVSLAFLEEQNSLQVNGALFRKVPSPLLYRFLVALLSG